MPSLVISSAASLGPLSIEVFGPTGAHQNSSPILLSSAVSTATLPDLAKGTYAIVATRPNGEALVRQVKVEAQPTNAFIDIVTGNQDSFLWQEAQRGFVPTASPSETVRLPNSLSSTGFANSVSGAARATLESIAANNAVQAELLPGSRGPQQPDADAGQGALYDLCSWEFVNGSWSEREPIDPTDVTPDYVRVPTGGGIGTSATAYALLDQSGFGPIVVVPRFRDGLSLTFLAEGLSAQGSADRAQNPSAARVPVAIAVPRNSRAADLLAALNAPSLPNALELWRQDTANTPTEGALEILADKNDDLMAAVLASHFLARFDPTAAPVNWLSNLMRRLPDYADPPVLLAWRLISGGLEGSGDTTRIQQLFEDASSKQCCLFARTRPLLTQGNRLYNRKIRSIDPSQGVVASPEIFLNYAAEAGGLESFWGIEPRRPGQLSQPLVGPLGVQVRLKDGEFLLP